jgi:hypothetical protein
MKKLSILFGCAAMIAASVLTSCKEKPEPVIIEDGFYVLGDATAFSALTEAGASDAKMAVGLLENKDNSERDGLYEKYVALEGGKTFKVVLKAGSAETTYGATMTEESLLDENGGQTWEQPTVTVLKGELTENGAAFQVAESGLYHIIIDLDRSEPKIGKQTVVIIPVEWGVSGITGNVTFPKPAFNKTSMTYVIEEATVESAGTFKFRYGDGWKYWLISGDVATTPETRVNVNTNLGENMLPGGANISIGRAVWKIELTWTLKKGAIKNGYTSKVTKVRDLESVPYEESTIYSLIGTAVKDDAGAATNWDFDRDFTYISNTAGHIVYEATNVSLAGATATSGSGEFKIRKNHDWNGGGDLGFSALQVVGATLEDAGGNFKIGADATFSKITFEFDWASEVTNAKLTFVQ